MCNCRWFCGYRAVLLKLAAHWNCMDGNSHLQKIRVLGYRVGEEDPSIISLKIPQGSPIGLEVCSLLTLHVSMNTNTTFLSSQVA